MRPDTAAGGRYNRSSPAREPSRASTTAHFTIRSNARAPAPAEIEAHLERAWTRFRDLFGVEPAPVEVVLRTRAPGEATAQADQGGAGSRVMAWTLVEGEDLAGQGMSDLAHEIAHIWFLDFMGRPEGLHQPHAWLHEAVACWHETASFREGRERWIRERSHERIPLAALFEMRNPVKEQPLVDLTVQLHGRLARGEIDVVDMNRQISEWASRHAHEIVAAGVRNMTWYAQSLSVFEFLLEALGPEGIRSISVGLRDGVRMGALSERFFPKLGLDELEGRWLRWLEGSGDPRSREPTADRAGS